MTIDRFANCYEGRYGKYWKDAARDEARSLIRMDNITVGADGVARWSHDGTCLPVETCEKLRYLNATWLDIDATKECRMRETLSQMRAYARTA